jgi:hypothetical protein
MCLSTVKLGIEQQLYYVSHRSQQERPAWGVIGWTSACSVRVGPLQSLALGRLGRLMHPIVSCIPGYYAFYTPVRFMTTRAAIQCQCIAFARTSLSSCFPFQKTATNNAKIPAAAPPPAPALPLTHPPNLAALPDVHPQPTMYLLLLPAHHPLCIFMPLVESLFLRFAVIHQ